MECTLVSGGKKYTNNAVKKVIITTPHKTSEDYLCEDHYEEFKKVQVDIVITTGKIVIKNI